MTDDPLVEPAEPPLPPSVMSRVVNPVVARLLASPFHGPLSDSLLLVSVVSRKTGTVYTTPVGYEQHESTLRVWTHHSTWWKNLRGGAPVRVLLRGAWRTGRATVVEDDDRVAALVRDALVRHGVDHGPRVGVEVRGDEVPSEDALADAVGGLVAVEIDLDADATFPGEGT
jgi:hypothetical protein